MSIEKNTNSENNNWKSSWAFLWAAVGSAIGLGNLWKFPYLVHKHGGSGFIFIFMIGLITLGIPLFYAEFFLGYKSGNDIYHGIKNIFPKNKIIPKTVAGICCTTAMSLVSFYSIISGWTLALLSNSILSPLEKLTSSAVVEQFNDLTNSISMQMFYSSIILIICFIVSIVGLGLLEKIVNILTPLLFGLLIILLVMVVIKIPTSQAYSFLYGFKNFTWSQELIIDALGHAFFTLSTGLGCIFIFGSYCKDNKSLIKTSLSVAVLDSFAGFLSCSILFPIIYQLNLDIKDSTSILFTTLPLTLKSLGLPRSSTSLFYALLFVAAMTSIFSITELIINIFRVFLKKSHFINCFITYTIMAAGMTSILIFKNYNLMDKFDHFVSTIGLPMGAIAFSVCCGIFMKINKINPILSKIYQFFYPIVIFGLMIVLLRF